MGCIDRCSHSARTGTKHDRSTGDLNGAPCQPDGLSPTAHRTRHDLQRRPQADRPSSTAHAPHPAGVASRPAVGAEVSVRHLLGPVLLTEYGSPWDSRSSPAPESGLIPHRWRRQPMRSARDTMIPSGART
jgi:hypothetical protein